MLRQLESIDAYAAVSEFALADAPPQIDPAMASEALAQYDPAMGDLREKVDCGLYDAELLSDSTKVYHLVLRHASRRCSNLITHSLLCSRIDALAATAARGETVGNYSEKRLYT